MATNTENSETAGTALTPSENPPSIIDSDNDDGILAGYSLPTLPELTKSSEEQSSLLTRSQYALVVFHGVADTYPTDSDIICRYSLTDGVEAAPGDRVVLYAVGWSSIKDYVVFEWAPIPEKDERDLTVVFKAADLPKDVNEFYQVCYVSNESAICGASVPFQVRTPNNEELTFALEEDMVVVRSSTAVAQDKLLKAQLDRENLNKKKVNLEKQLRSLEDKHSLTLRRLDRLQETLSTSNALNEELNKENARLLGINEQMLCTQKQLEETQIKLDDAEKEKKMMQKSLEDKIKATEDHRDKLEILIKNSEELLAQATLQICALQQDQKKLETEVAVANGNLQHNEQVRASLSTKNFELENQLTVYKFNLNNAQKESLRLQAELEELAEEKNELTEQLKSAKQFEEEHKNFHEDYSTTHRGRAIMENTKLRKTVEDMQLTISSLEHEKTTLEQVLEDMLNAQKNLCPDHCGLEKRVAQLQYRLDEATSSEKAKEKKPSYRHTDQSSSLENQVETLAKLLDDSLKENELRLQENMALRIQNEILETTISTDKSKSEEYVVVSTCDNSRVNQHTSEGQLHNTGTMTVNSYGSMYELNVELDKLRHRLVDQQKLVDDYARCLADKDEQMCNLKSEKKALEKGFVGACNELKLEIANLVSKNAALVEQEAQSQELKNEMQRITFMNEELLVQNSSLMERIHDSKQDSSTSTDVNTLQKSPDTEDLNTTLKIENEQLREELKTICEKLNTMVGQLQQHKERNVSLENELDAGKKMITLVESRYSILNEQHDILLQRLTSLSTKVDDKCRHEFCVEPKLNQISQNVDHLLSAVEKLTSCSEAKQDEHSSSNDADELKCRLELAREEYEKLHTVMINYRTKYNELKTRYMKKAGSSETGMGWA